MHSGNVGLSQNLDTLVDAAARLSRYPDLAVVVVGDGAKRPALEARARAQNLTNVRFLPYQPKSRLHESFATADVFVVSLKAGLAGYIVPSKLYGILAAGRPYVAAVEEDSEVATITRKYGCGLLAEPGDPDDLAAEDPHALPRPRPGAAGSAPMPGRPGSSSTGRSRSRRTMTCSARGSLGATSSGARHS